MDGKKRIYADWDSFSGYMATKRKKLNDQLADKSLSHVRAPLFRDMVIYVDGYTEPNQLELRRAIGLHGGSFVYQPSANTTHVVAENLTPSKTKEFRNLHVVRPAWIIDCIEKGKLLPTHLYSLPRAGSSTFVNQGWPQRSYGPGLGVCTCLDDYEKSHVSVSVVKLDRGLGNAAVSGDGKKMDTEMADAKESQDNLDPSFVSEISLAESVGSERDSNGVLAREVQQKGSSFDVGHGKKARPRPAFGLQKATDAGFVESFYHQSRLHHLSTWKVRLKEQCAARMGLQQSKGDKNGDSVVVDDFSLVNENSRPRRVYVHIDLDCFFAQVAQRDNENYKGKPVVVSHSRAQDSSGDVASASYEARAFGIQNGMWLGEVKKLCPNVIVTPYEFEKYEEASNAIYDAFFTCTSRVMPVSVDEAYLDVSHIDNFQEAVAEVRRAIFYYTGLTASAGMGPNLLLARMATKRAKPNGQFWLDLSGAESFLANLPVEDLPGVGYSLKRKLADIGIQTIDALKACKLTRLQSLFGPKTGASLYNFARGVDDRELELSKPRKTVSAEINWGVRLSTVPEVKGFIGQVVKEVCKRLQEGKVVGYTATLRVNRRAKGAPINPSKVLGCGWTVSVNRAHKFAEGVSQADDVLAVVNRMYDDTGVDPEEIRGLGVHFTDLEDASKDRGKQISIDKVFNPLKQEEMSDGDIVIVSSKPRKPVVAAVLRGELMHTKMESRSSTGGVPKESVNTHLRRIPVVSSDGAKSLSVMSRKPADRAGPSSSGMFVPEDLKDVLDLNVLLELPVSIRREVIDEAKRSLLHLERVGGMRGNSTESFSVTCGKREVFAFEDSDASCVAAAAGDLMSEAKQPTELDLLLLRTYGKHLIAKGDLGLLVQFMKSIRSQAHMNGKEHWMQCYSQLIDVIQAGVKEKWGHGMKALRF